MSKAVIADELATCAALWPSLNAQNPRVLDAYAEQLIGFSDEEIRAGFRRVRGEHDGMSFPKPATLKAYCGAARNRFSAEQAPRLHPDAICSACGTERLYHSENGRTYPLHGDSCPLRRADQLRDFTPTWSGAGA